MTIITAKRELSNLKKTKEMQNRSMEDMMVKVMKSVTDSIKSNDKMFSDLEEKRLKFEEQQKLKGRA